MSILISIAILAVCGFLLAVTLPVKIGVRVAGGTDDGFDVQSSIHIYNGFFGAGLRYLNDRYRLQLYLLSKVLIDLDITRLVLRESKKKPDKAKKTKKDQKAEKDKPKMTIMERLKEYHYQFKEYWPLVKQGIKDITSIIRFDRFSADIILGLGNPAITGWLSGLLFSINGFLPDSIEFKPSFDFTRQVAHGDFSMKVTVFTHRFWHILFLRLPEFYRFYRYHKKQEAELVTQEAS